MRNSVWRFIYEDLSSKVDMSLSMNLHLPLEADDVSGDAIARSL